MLIPLGMVSPRRNKLRPATRNRWPFHFDLPRSERKTDQAFAASISSLSSVHFSEAKPALTAGVVLIVMCLLRQMYHAT